MEFRYEYNLSVSTTDTYALSYLDKTAFIHTHFLTMSSLFCSFPFGFYIFVIKSNIVYVVHKLMYFIQFQRFQIFKV